MVSGRCFNIKGDLDEINLELVDGISKTQITGAPPDVRSSPARNVESRYVRLTNHNLDIMGHRDVPQIPSYG
jgi:hypothetical protein